MWVDAVASFQKSLAALPLTNYDAGETVLAEGSRTDQLLILRWGNVAIVRAGIEIARVSEPGAVFGEISALLDCAHTATVRALVLSQFHVVHPAALQDPAALFYVAAILARRIDEANRSLVELISEIQDKPRSVVDITIKKMQRLLSASGATFAYAGHSYNPFA
jgi:CRP-like cAMP-binding protein